MSIETDVKNRTYSLEADLLPIIHGKIALPNPETLATDAGASILHYREMHCGDALLPAGKKWGVRFFLDYTQGGQLTGSGLVAWTEWKDGAYRATAMKFAICKHEQKSGAGANPSRGWHPSRCVKCGLDMTVDSGD